jgi:hypothetical protein
MQSVNNERPHERNRGQHCVDPQRRHTPLLRQSDDACNNFHEESTSRPNLDIWLAARE